MAVDLLINLPVPNEPGFNDNATNIWPQFNTSIGQLNADIAAMNLNATTSTSTSSVAIGTGTKTFTVQTGKSYVKNMPIRIASTATLGAYMDGYVDTYSGSTLTVNVVGVGGSGTLASWNVFLSPALTYNALLNDLFITGLGKRLGYSTGAGLTYTQGAGSGKQTAVAVTSMTGVVTMNASSLAANAKATFLITNAAFNNNTLAVVGVRGGVANEQSYQVSWRATSGGVQIILWNTSGGALAEAVEIMYAIVQGSAN